MAADGPDNPAATPSDATRAQKTLGYLQTYPTTIVIDGKEVSASDVTAIYERGRGLGAAGDAGRAEASARLAEAFGLDATKITPAVLDDFLRFIDDKWAVPPPAAVKPGKRRRIELSGFASADNPLGVHRDCAEIFDPRTAPGTESASDEPTPEGESG